MKNLNSDILNRIVTESTQKRIKKGILSGAHITVFQDGKSILDKTYGYKSANGVPLERDAIYRIASMTKPITAVALLIEQEKGRLNIFDDVSKYLPEFGEMLINKEDGTCVKAQNSIKLYMLVSHISGINSAFIESDENPIPRTERNIENIVDYTAKFPLKFEPGTAQEYNTIGYDVAARVIEITSGMEYSQYLRENLFNKLKMDDTSFEPNEDRWKRMVAIHGFDRKGAFDVESPANTVIQGFSVKYHGAGFALVSTADDYLKFAEMLQNGGKSADGTVIMSEKSVELLKTPVVDDSIMPGSQKWGLGVRVITDNDYILPKGTFGWSGMFGSHFWIDPENKITAVYMKNSAYDGGAGCRTGNEFEENVMKALEKKK